MVKQSTVWKGGRNTWSGQKILDPVLWDGFLHGMDQTRILRSSESHPVPHLQSSPPLPVLFPSHLLSSPLFSTLPLHLPSPPLSISSFPPHLAPPPLLLLISVFSFLLPTSLHPSPLVPFLLFHWVIYFWQNLCSQGLLCSSVDSFKNTKMGINCCLESPLFEKKIVNLLAVSVRFLKLDMCGMRSEHRMVTWRRLCTTFWFFSWLWAFLIPGVWSCLGIS